MLDMDKFDALQVSIASPEKIRSWSYGEVKNLRLLTTVRISRNVTVFSAKRYSVLKKTMNVSAVNIRAFAIKVLFAKDVTLKLLSPLLEENAWAIFSW